MVIISDISVFNPFRFGKITVFHQARLWGALGQIVHTLLKTVWGVLSFLREPSFFVFIFETGSHCITLDSLELSM